MAATIDTRTRTCIYIIIVLLCLISLTRVSSAARILILPAFVKNHGVGMGIIAEILAKDGHRVTMLLPSSDPFTDTPTTLYKIKSISVPINSSDFRSRIGNFTSLIVEEGFSVGKFKILGSLLADVCDDMFNNHAALADLRGMQQFDFAIVGSNSHCGLLFTEYFELPYVSFAFTNAEETQWHAPLPLSYVPLCMAGLTDNMSFTQRLRNIVSYWVGDIMRDFIMFAPYREIQQKHDISTKLKIQDIQSKARLWLWAADFSLEFPRPLMPHVIPIGAFSAEKVKPLPKELDEWIQGSGDNGIVVFSMGSQYKDMGANLTHIIAEALSGLPQRVVWGHGGTTPDNLGSNTRILKWMPQNDLLAHPKTRLFVTHGGTNGIKEGLYHGVPMVCIPLAGDQFDNAAKVEGRQLGKVVSDHRSMTSQSLYNVMNNVIEDTSYKRRAQKLSAISHDKLMTAEESVVYWINYVFKHGTDHLISQVPNLTWYQYYLLDIAAFLLVVVLVIGYVITKICYLVHGMCCRKDLSQKVKSE